MVQSILLVINLFFLEVFLSCDNAAVLAILVKDLKEEDRPKALKYGILGAFLFRGASLFLISWLIRIIWLKLFAGAWLIFLCGNWITGGEDDKLLKKPKSLLKAIIMVEFMDMAFSMDNLFAVTAMTTNIYIILTGVFMGIIAMRFVAGWFTKFMIKYPTLESATYVIISFLGLRLIIMGSIKLTNKAFEEPEYINWLFSLFTLSVFFSTIIFKKREKV